MKIRLWISVTLVAAVITTALAAPPVVVLDHAPDELIVKFRRGVADSLTAQIESGTALRKMTLSPGLDKTNRAYGLREVRPLFRDFERNRKAMEVLRQKDERLLGDRERHLQRRLRRAEKRARIADLCGIYRLKVRLGAGQTIEEVRQSYQSDPNVEYAEFNYIVSANRTPNDPLYGIQWSVNNTGQDYPYSGRFNTPPGSPDSDIDAPEAWDDATGSSEIIVAVVDTGVDYNHRDLQNNMWVNDAELAGTAGVDDDNNGYVDDIYGYDFVNGDGDPVDDVGHGTHCAGTIAAEGDNGLDVAGVCWDARIMALKFLAANGSGNISDALTAFYYAVENGADVISNSWGGGGFSQATQDIINYAHSQGIIVVASAGNDGLNYPQYPGYYDNMLSVGATNSLDGRAPFSNYGSWVDIAAPGVDILSLRATGTYLGTPYDGYTTILSGTSMSCPHVSGACALLLSIDPQMTSDRLEQYLEDSADPIDPNICASGRLNIFGAVRQVIGPDGRILLDSEAYPCYGDISIELRDSHLGDIAALDVAIMTDGGDLETVTLARRSPGLGIFNGSIDIETASPIIGDGVLQVAPGQTITVIYDDADDGTGAPATAVDSAIVDCEPPSIFGVRVGYPGRAPAISFSTDEPTTGRIRCGVNCGGPYTIEASDTTLADTHTIVLHGVLPETRYYFVVDANDAAGNSVVDTNRGRCYKFTTTGPTVIFVPWQCQTIQQAIDNSWDGGMVCVANGVYSGSGNTDLDFKGSRITVRSLGGPQHCIIDCNGTPDQPHRAFHFHSGEDANSVAKGFTIINGYIPGSWYVGIGGAILCANASSPTISDCIFINNTAGWDGGAICNFNGNLNINNCAFTSNRAIGNDGGAINNETGSVNVSSSRFAGNRCFDWGGAIRSINSSKVSVTNCILSGNRSDDGGGMFIFHDSIARVTNCTFAGNVAPYGNGLACGSWVPVNDIRITNSIFADGAPEIVNNDYSLLDVTYTNILGAWPGAGNIDSDPCFADPGYWDSETWVDGDYHLRSQSGRWDEQSHKWVKDSATSRCIDAGDLNSDWRLEPWPNGQRVNMGAFGNTPHASKSLLIPQPVEAHLTLVPRVFTGWGKGRWLRASLLLPRGFEVQDVDKNAPAIIEPVGIRSAEIKVHRRPWGRVEIEILFDRRAVSAAIPQGSTELTVIASLVDGRYVYGAATVWKLPYHDCSRLRDFAAQWLSTGPNLDADLNGNNMVNLVDFSMLADEY